VTDHPRQARPFDPWNVYDELAKLGIVLKQRRPGKVYMTCPKCSPTRRKKNAECLEVRVLDNELRAYWQCFHPDCKGWTVTEVHKPFPDDDGRRGVERPDPLRRPGPPPVRTPPPTPPLEKIAALLNRTTAIDDNNMAVTYLRGRDLDPTLVDSGVLRLLPAMGPYLPTMVAVVTDFTDASRITGLQFTELKDYGRARGERKFLTGSRMGGSVVRFISDSEVTTELGISEGTESAISVMTAMKRAGRMILPVWSALNAGNLAKLPVLAGIERLHVFADRDESGAGQKAAETLAKRWREAGREVRIVFPPRGDWNE
jgi:putative DNA primase/helicase